MVFLLDGSCLEKGVGYVGTGGSVGVFFCFGISILACCPEPLSAQPGFRSQLSGHSRYLVMIPWKTGNLTKFMFSVSLGTGTLLPACVVTGASLLPQEVVLPAPGHLFPHWCLGFVQPCGELGQGNDPIKSYAEQHQKQVLTRQFPNVAQMLGKRGLWARVAVDGVRWDGFFWCWCWSMKTC